MDTHRLYENRNNGLVEAREVMRKGYVSKTHSLEVCWICSKNHKEEIDMLLDAGMPLRTISRKMKWWYDECGFYRVFPSEASLRRYVKHRYEQRVRKSKRKYDERVNLMHGHVQTWQEIIKRKNKILDMEQKGLATHKDVVDVTRLSLCVLDKVIKDIQYLSLNAEGVPNCHFKPYGI